MADARATIVISANAKDATKTFKDLNKSSSGFGNAMSKLGKGVGKAAKVIGASIVGMAVGFTALAVKVGNEAVTAFQEQERAENRLATIMTNVTGATQAQIEAMKSLAIELQKTTVLGDEVTIAGQSQLASFGANAEMMKSLTPALGDLAVAQYGVNVSQEQMIQSANMMGKALEGQVGALTRAGVLVSDEYAKALDEAATKEERAAILAKIVADNYGGLAESMASTTEGMRKQVSNMIGDMKESLGAKLLPIVKSLSQFVLNNMDKLEAIFDVFGGTLTSIFDSIGPMLPAIADAFVALGSAIGDLAPMFAGMIAQALPVVLDLFAQLMPIISEVAGVFLDMAGDALPVLGKLISNLLSAIKPLIPPLLTLIEKALYPWIEAFEVLANSGVFDGLIGLLVSIVENGLIPLYEAVGPILPMLMELLTDILEPILPPLTEIIKTLLPPLVEIVKLAVDAFKMLMNAIKPFLDWILPPLMWLLQGLADIISYVVVGSIEHIRNSFDKLKEKIEVIKEAFRAIKKFFVDTWKSIWGSIKGFINKIIDGINIMIRGLNKIKFDVPDWVPFIGGKEFGFHLRQIPHLETGGIVDKPTLALIGEVPEAVTPLEKLPDILAKTQRQQPVLQQAAAPIYKLYFPNAKIVDSSFIAWFTRKQREFQLLENKRLGLT